MDFLPGVPASYVSARLEAAGGNEIRSGKLASPESSAALAVNCFGWFHDRPAQLPSFGEFQAGFPALEVDIEYCARFPWSGGRHPWLDAAVVTKTHLIGVESKRFEPFRDKKTVSLSDAYDRPVWGDDMGPFEAMRDNLRAENIRFEYLDAAQLVKHAFGLVTDARRKGLKPALVYLFAEPEMRDGKPIGAAAHARHRAEIARFAEAVDGAIVAFHALSYRDWLASWPDQDFEMANHGKAILAAFRP